MKQPRTLHLVGRILTLLVALFIAVIGLRLIVDPAAAAAGFGLPDAPVAHNDFLRVKGVRDVVTGLLLAVGLVWGDDRILGRLVLVGALIPLGDATVVSIYGDASAAWQVHLPAALATLAGGTCLVLAPRRRGRLDTLPHQPATPGGR